MSESTPELTNAAMQIRKRGYTILDGVIPATAIDEVRETVADALARNRERAAAGFTNSPSGEVAVEQAVDFVCAAR